jgi:hypothetical protein
MPIRYLDTLTITGGISATADITTTGRILSGGMDITKAIGDTIGFASNTSTGSVVPLTGNNTASGRYASIVNGLSNFSSSSFSTIGGGTYNRSLSIDENNTNTPNNQPYSASYMYFHGNCNSFIGGGSCNNIFACIPPGICVACSTNPLVADTRNSAIGGGCNNVIRSSCFPNISAYYTALSRQANRVSPLQPVNALVGTEARDSIINGGSGNIIDGSSCGHIIGGVNNCVKGAQSGTIGGTCNIVQGCNSEIIGGSCNIIGQDIYGLAADGKCILDPTGQYSSSRNAVIINGCSNAICGDSVGSTIINGRSNTIYCDYNTILNGLFHTIEGKGCSVITGGFANSINGGRSGIF